MAAVAADVGEGTDVAVVFGAPEYVLGVFAGQFFGVGGLFHFPFACLMACSVCFSW